MNPKANTRNVDLVRNILVDELVELYREKMETNEAEVLMELYREEEPLQKVAKRLQITFPPPTRLATLALRRRWERS